MAMKALPFLILLLSFCMFARTSFAVSPDEIHALNQQVQNQFHCQAEDNAWSYHQNVSVLNKVSNVFLDHCGGNGIIGVQQANQPWVFTNCGSVASLHPPSPLNLPILYWPKRDKEWSQWVNQDICNIWKPVPWSTEIQQISAEYERNNAKTNK